MHNQLIPGFLAEIPKLQQALTLSDLPYEIALDCGVLNTDVCGFTKITEAVSSGGHYGVEVITEVLNTYFDAMIPCIEGCNGYLMKYGGDSIFAIFPGERKQSASNMLSCRDLMYSALVPLNEQFEQKYGFKIDFDGAMDWGKCRLCIVGDPEIHLDYYVDGAVLNSLYQLCAKASAGMMLHPDDFQNIALEPLKDSASLQRSIHAQNRFFPGKVLQKLGEKGFSAELRNTAVIFVNMAEDRELSPLEFMQYYLGVQKIVYDLDGTINKIDYSDKGYIIIITFGTPYTHADDIDRAISAAYRIKLLKHNSIKSKIGLTYNNIFAGILGSRNRYEYGIIGNAVNISARLMSASAGGEICFSEELLDYVKQRFETGFVEETKVKGIAEPLRIHTIKREVPGSWKAMQDKYKDRVPVSFLEDIEAATKQIMAPTGALISISGASGCGKSFLAYHIIKSLPEDEYIIEVFALEQFNKSNQAAWLRKVLLHKGIIDEYDAQYEGLYQYCKELGLELKHDFIKGFFCPPSDSSKALQAAELRIIVDVLASALGSLFKSARCILIDDLHYMDESSLKVWQKALPMLQSTSCNIICTADNDFGISKIGNPSLQIKLSDLDYDACKALLKHELGVVSDDAVAYLKEMTAANPLFLIEVCEAIKRNRRTSQDVISVSLLKRMEKQGIISNTIENILLHEYENLEANARQMLKVASIIGKAFAIDELKIIGNRDIKEDFLTVINHLDSSKVIQKKDYDPRIEYVFNSYLMRDAIYRTILMQEKQSLHWQIGGYYEHKYAEHLPENSELIAQHYILASDADKACFYAMMAADKTSSLAAYAEANYFLEQALKFCTEDHLRYTIKLKQVKNFINLGDAKQASEIVEHINIHLRKHITDDFYYQQIRCLSLAGSATAITKFVNTHLQKVKDSEIRLSIQLHYLEALQKQNNRAEFEALSETLISSLKKKRNPKQKGNLYATMASYYVSRSNYAAAKSIYTKLRRLAKQSNDLIHKRIAINGLGIVYSRTGNKARAEKYLQEALQLCKKLGDYNGYSKIIMDLGTLQRNVGDIGGAIESYTQSLATANLIGNRMQQSIALYNLGEANYYLNEFDKALEYFNKSKVMAIDLDDKVGIGFCNDAIGDILFNKERFDEALETYSANLILQTELDDTEGIAHTLGNLGNIAKKRHDYVSARSYYQKQIDILEKVGDIDGKGRAYFNMAMVEIEDSNPASAKKLLLIALELFTKCNAEIFIQITNAQLQKLS